MPFTLNLIGTHFWGRAEPHQDGSYITTEWITILIPLIPIKSFRLRPTNSSNSSSQEYEVFQKFTSVYTKQVQHVYKVVAMFLVAFVIALYLLIDIGFNQNNAVGVIWFFSIFFVSYVVFIIWVDRFTK
jgi:hypothetical protein